MNTVATKNTGGHLTCHCGIMSLPWVKIKQITERHPVDMCVEEEEGAGEGGRDREAKRWIHQIIRVLSLVRRSVIFFYVFL